MTERCGRGFLYNWNSHPFLSIISDEKIQQTLGLMGQPVDAKLIPAIAREVCQRTSSAAMLDGSIAKIGNQYLLTFKAVNGESGKTLASTEAQTAIADKLAQLVLKGDIRAAQELADRVEGRPRPMAPPAEQSGVETRQ